MDQYPGDMLLQYVVGGTYPRPDEPTIAELPRTGPLLTPIAGFSAAYPAALCGLLRLRADHFGPGHHGTLLTTQFNVRRLQRHTLQHDGARLTSQNTDFLVSTDWDFHPTDVLENADGSLLKSGGTAYGAIARETADAVFLRTTTLEETRIARADIASIEPSDVSFMPQGLEKTMTPQELNDLLEYLYSLK
jgi:hypothetical protein